MNKQIIFSELLLLDIDNTVLGILALHFLILPFSLFYIFEFSKWTNPRHITDSHSILDYFPFVLFSFGIADDHVPS